MEPDAGIVGKAKRFPWWVSYAVIACLVPGLYALVRPEMTEQFGIYTAVISPVSLNLILLYGIWGYESHKRMRGRRRTARWLVFLGGCAVLTLIFRLGFGIETIFG